MKDLIFSRTEELIGREAILKLKQSSVCVFGIGGVGSAAVEGLARAGIGSITVVDNDVIDVTNINRQIIARIDNIGIKKTYASKERILKINPDCNVIAKNMFFLPDNSSEIDFSQYDYIIDAVDTVSAKIEIIVCAKAANVSVISSMGTGNKLDPTMFKVADIFDTSVCPLARVMRRELKNRGITDAKVVYSEETPVVHGSVPASISFVPPVAGYIMAGEVVRDLIKNTDNR